MRFLVARAFLILLIFFPGRGASADEAIKIGLMTHLTGDFAAWGQAYLEGVTLGQEQLNSSGGVRGINIALEIEDTHFDSASTATASKKLLDVSRVPIAMVSTFTEAMVAGPMFQRAKVPLLVFGDGGGQIETLGSFVFSTGTWVDGYALAASKFLADRRKARTVALVATNNPWSQSTANSFKRDFEHRGGTIVYRADLNPSDSDFRTIVQRIRNSGVDAVFAPLTAGVIPFFEQARRMNLGLPIMVAGGALDTDVIAAAPQAVEGRYVTNAFLDQRRPRAQEFLAQYRRKYGKEPLYPSVSARGFDGFMAIANALRGAKSLAGEDLQEALFSVDFEGVGFHLRIDKQGTALLPVKVLQVKSGRLVVVGDINPARVIFEKNHP